MMNVIYWLPTPWLLAQADWLGSMVGGRWRCFCIHCVNRVNSCSALDKYDDSTINIVQVFLLLLL